MPIFTYLTEAVVRDSVKELDGKTLNRPRLRASDGTSFVYCVDVDIGQKKLDPNTADEVVAPLRNIPIATGNQELLYADAGAAVRLRRSGSGRWEVVRFSKRKPGTYRRIGVRIPYPGIEDVEYALGRRGDRARGAGFHLRGARDIRRLRQRALWAIGLFRSETLIEIQS